MLELEWDEDKRRANIQKHGLDFADAKHLNWDNATYIQDNTLPLPRAKILGIRALEAPALSGRVL